MSERNYYVLCDDSCKFPAMTKEQILTAIEQALTTGEIKDVDTGFITKIKEQNGGGGVKFWVGTNAEYNALTDKEDNCFYIITDDTTAADTDAFIAELNERLITVETENNGMLDGSVVVKKADFANTAQSAATAQNAASAQNAALATSATILTKSSSAWTTVRSSTGTNKKLSKAGVYVFILNFITTHGDVGIGYFVSGRKSTVIMADYEIVIDTDGTVENPLVGVEDAWELKARLICEI